MDIWGIKAVESDIGLELLDYLKNDYQEHQYVNLKEIIQALTDDNQIYKVYRELDEKSLGTIAGKDLCEIQNNHYRKIRNTEVTSLALAEVITSIKNEGGYTIFADNEILLTDSDLVYDKEDIDWLKENIEIYATHSSMEWPTASDNVARTHHVYNVLDSLNAMYPEQNPLPKRKTLSELVSEDDQKIIVACYHDINAKFQNEDIKDMVPQGMLADAVSRFGIIAVGCLLAHSIQLDEMNEKITRENVDWANTYPHINQLPTGLLTNGGVLNELVTEYRAYLSIPDHESSAFQSENHVYGYVCDKNGMYDEKYILLDQPKDMACFIMKYGNKNYTGEIIITDVMDQLILNTIGNFINQCPNKETLDNILEHLLPMQEEEIVPPEFEHYTISEYVSAFMPDWEEEEGEENSQEIY